MIIFVDMVYSAKEFKVVNGKPIVLVEAGRDRLFGYSIKTYMCYKSDVDVSAGDYVELKSGESLALRASCKKFVECVDLMLAEAELHD